MKKLLLLSAMLCLVLNAFSQETGTFTDTRDGKVYKTVKIGDQIMMAENLAFKPNKGNFWAYDNDNANIAVYGYIYDWETAKKVAPKGWHLPTKVEWKTLCANTGFEKPIVYENLIESGSFGFNALFGGYRSPLSEFKRIGENTEFWSSETDEDGNPWSFEFHLDFNMVSFGVKDPSCGFYVRLFKD